jgi:hypothetical protein
MQQKQFKAVLFSDEGAKSGRRKKMGWIAVEAQP